LPPASQRLVSRRGSLDWCCMPRFDSEPCFGRLLDWEHAGYCSIAPAQGGFDCTRRYLDDTRVLCTRFQTETGVAQLFDLLELTDTDELRPNRQLLRIVEGLEGEVEINSGRSATFRGIEIHQCDDGRSHLPHKFVSKPPVGGG
jgi:GH15 family glucan-1,4-alpha-glucosidase